MQLKTDELIWDKDTYARQGTSANTIEQYAAALEIGAQFPAIKVERLIHYDGTDQQIVSIRDGYHRWMAHKKQHAETIEAEFWTDETLDYSQRHVRCLLKAQSAFYNKEHGDRTTEKDKQEAARYIAENDPEQQWTDEAIGDMIGAPTRTVNRWVSDIRAKQTANRDSVIYRLTRLGWTQQRIGQVVGLDRSRVTQIVNNGQMAKINNLLQAQVA